MSLKINVIYKGIIYRVKGIKVLCSVVWTVIILLIAIVGMGVWMIINVYDDNIKSLSIVDNSPNFNQLNATDKIEVEAPSIDFGKSDDVEDSKVSVFDMEIRNVEFKEATEEPNVVKPSPNPKQEYEYEYEYHESDEYSPDLKWQGDPSVSLTNEELKEHPPIIKPEDITPLVLLKSDELHPVDRIRSDHIKPSERINPEEIKPHERIKPMIDEVKPYERIRPNLDEIKPYERVIPRQDDVKLYERVISRPDEIKPSERLRPTGLRPSEKVKSDNFFPISRDETMPLGRIDFEEIKSHDRIEPSIRIPSDRVRIDTIPPKRITDGSLLINPIIKSLPEIQEKKDMKLIPIKLVPKDLKAPPLVKSSIINESEDDYVPFHDLGYPNLRKIGRERVDGERWKPTKDILPTNGRNPTRGDPVTLTNQFLRKSGIPATDSLTYVGPPVVGYGSNPYEKLTRDRIREYDQFWETYTGKKADFKFKVNETAKNYMRPHLRGLRPTGSEYDLPVRPDAQVPPKVQRQNEGKMMYRPLRPPTSNPNRRIEINPTPTPSSSLPLLNPLQELYDYSKKLAASLLSFNSKSTEQLQDSSEKLAEYGIKLLENHNHIFKQPPGSPFNRIISLIPNADRLKSMDPFELSLITWTFLDFWEFLIEKVGTLSDKDLILLQQRLEHLRRRKDDAMTRVFVNETLTRYTSGNQRSIGRYEASNITNMYENKNYEESIDKSEEIISSPDQEEISEVVPTNNLPILSGLFPSLSSISLNEKGEDIGVVNESSDTIKIDESVKSGVVNSFHSKNMDAPAEDTIKKENFSENTETTKGPMVDVENAALHIKNEPKSKITTDTENKRETNGGSKIIVSTSVTVVNENNSLPNKTETLKNTTDVQFTGEKNLFRRTMQRLMNILVSPRNEQRSLTQNNPSPLIETGRSNSWDPLGFFSSESRMKFMQFAVKVVFNFGKVYIKKPYALDCSMLLFCKDLNQAARRGGGMEAMAAKLKSVGLKVLTESEQELRESDTLGEVWRSVTAWTPLQCDAMFPRCDGPKALEIVNEVAVGSSQ